MSTVTGYEVTLLELLLEYFERSDRGEDASITLPYTNIEKCFLQLNETYDGAKIYLISPDLFELIKYSDKFEYSQEPQHKSINGRRFTLYGVLYDAVIIVDSSLYGHNYIWFANRIQESTNTFLKHKLIIS